MLFVTLGTHERPFYRLVKEIERLIAEDKIKEKVVIQLGFTDYAVRGAECHKYLPQDEYDTLLNESDVVITHGGSGSILSALSLGKPVVIVPRMRKFGEHVNDHQLQIAEEFKDRDGVAVVSEIKDLLSYIEKVKSVNIKPERTKPPAFNIIESALEKWSKG